MKKTIIATAVSAALMAPVAAQADVTVYGRVHQGIKFENPEKGESKTNFVGIGSRFGIKASSDLGNGMTASAQYEFATVSDKSAVVEIDKDDIDGLDDNLTIGGGVNGTRIAKVGVSGAFGSIDLGNQWSAWYNKVGVYVDPTFSVGPAKHIGPFRTANTIKYSHSFGPVSLEVDTRLDDTKDEDGKPVEGGDGHAIAASVAVNDNITIAAGIDDTKDGDELMGAAIKVSLGNYSVSLAQQSQEHDIKKTESDVTQVWANGSFFGNTNVWLGYGTYDKAKNTDIEPSALNLGIYHSVGGGLGLIYEGKSYDADEKGKDKTSHVFGIRLDF